MSADRRNGRRLTPKPSTTAGAAPGSSAFGQDAGELAPCAHRAAAVARCTTTSFGHLMRARRPVPPRAFASATPASSVSSPSTEGRRHEPDARAGRAKDDRDVEAGPGGENQARPAAPPARSARRRRRRAPSGAPSARAAARVVGRAVDGEVHDRSPNGRSRAMAPRARRASVRQRLQTGASSGAGDRARSRS